VYSTLIELNEQIISRQQREEKAAASFSVSRPWYLCWEIYALLLVTVGLRFIRLDTTQFDTDQAKLFGLAYEAIHNGQLPATGILSSIRILNPPAILYMMMIPAAFGANPFGAALFIALFNVAAVLLCYFFVRCYYGRFPATIAALLFATAARAVYYSRFSWQQNLLPFFLMLFLIVLFQGVVRRRSGWFAPALILIAWMAQLHSTGAMLLAMLALAVVLAWKTLRWWDILLGIVVSLLLYAPFFYWEYSSHLYDLHAYLDFQKKYTWEDTSQFTYYYYTLGLSPYASFMNDIPPVGSRLLPHWHWLTKIKYLLLLCEIGGMVVALGKALLIRVPVEKGLAPLQQVWRWCVSYYTTLCKDPYRCGLLLLLAWQLVPLFALRRQSLPIYPHYFIVFFPGQYLFIALLFTWVVEWLKRWQGWETFGRGAIVAISILLVVMQGAGSSLMILDFVRGRIYADVDVTLQQVIRQAEQLALKQHIKRIYVLFNVKTEDTMRVLTYQSHIPVTLVSTSCLMLPGSPDERAVLVVPPLHRNTEALATQFGHGQHQGDVARLRGEPFHLYTVQGNASTTSTQAGFQQHLQAEESVMQKLKTNATVFVSRWRFTRNAPTQWRTTYIYSFVAKGPGGKQQGVQCTVSNAAPGDELLAPMQFKQWHTSQIEVQAKYTVRAPRTIALGSLTLLTDTFVESPKSRLLTDKGKDWLTLSLQK
jgi:4-amino-4-deoxy-L-arabinose transferase-like glycosyltransferase